MKKLILSTIIFCFLATSYVSAQSVTIVPGASPTPGIKLSNVIANRRIVLWEEGNNDHQFYGLGINNNTLRYQIPSSIQSHIFYAGASTTTSNELMRITGTGTVGIGTTTPATTLDVRGSAAAITVGNTAGSGGGLFLGNPSHGIQRGFPILYNDNNVGLFTVGNIYLSGNGKVTDQFLLTFNGEVGLGTSDFTPGEKFAVKTGTSQFGIMPGMLDNVANAAWTTLDMKGFNQGIRIWDNLSVSDKVGIGTTTPDSPLHVTGAGFTTPSLARTFFAQGTPLTSNTSASGAIKVHADGYFWADGGGFVATSDARIKNIIGRTNTGDDLEKLRKIAVTDYRYIDEVSNGSTPQKKVIAQQLKEIFPIAVNQNKGIIPNVYQVAQKVTIVGNTTQIVTTKAHDFATGDMVKLIIETSGEKTLEVTVLDTHTFSVAEVLDKSVFVYGKKVEDLLNVDYDAVAMLNVSATQELAKQVDALKRKNEELEAKVAEMDDLKSQMASLRSLIMKTNSEEEAVRGSENKK